MAWSDFEACPPASVKAPVPVTTLEEPLPPGPDPPPGGGGGLPDGGVLALPFAAWELPDGAVATRVVLDGFATVVAVASRDIEIFGMAAFVAPLAQTGLGGAQLGEDKRTPSTVTIEPGRLLVIRVASCVSLGRLSVRTAPGIDGPGTVLVPTPAAPDGDPLCLEQSLNRGPETLRASRH